LSTSSGITGRGLAKIVIVPILLLLCLLLSLFLRVGGGGDHGLFNIGEFLFGFQVFCIGDVDWSIERASGVAASGAVG